MEDLIEVLKKTNSRIDEDISNELLGQILSLVIKHPLDEDRAVCQDRIELLIKQASESGKNDN